MALRIRRNTNLEPRMEMTPLLDVIFLLLTFFIYSLVLTVRAQIVPITLPSLGTGQPVGDVQIATITVNQLGELFLDAKPIARAELEVQLKEMAAQPKPPKFFLAFDNEPGQKDRGPMLLSLINLFRELKIDGFSIVGSPQSPADSSAPKQTPVVPNATIP